MTPASPPSPSLPAIDILTLHAADDARVFGRQARSLGRVSERVRLVAPGTEAAVRDGVELVGVPAPVGRLERFVVTPWRILRAGRRGGADVVYLHDASMLFLLPLLRIAGRRCVYDAHEDYGNMVRHRDWIPGPFRGLAGRGADLYERGLARLAGGVATATGPLRDKFPHAHAVTVYNLPTDDVLERGAAQQTPARDREFDLVHLGTFNLRRREFFAGVLRRLIERRPALRVLIIGARGDQAAWWRRRFTPRNVELRGWVSHDQVPALLGRCRVGVSVHPWLTPHLALAVPVKIFEYMACGCAVVSSRMPELERLLQPEDRDRITVVDGAEEADWIDAIDGWLADPGRIDRQAGALRQVLPERYSWRSEEQKLLRFFADLTADLPRGAPAALRTVATGGGAR